MLPLKPPYNILHFINILLSPNICTFWDTETFLHPHPIYFSHFQIWTFWPQKPKNSNLTNSFLAYYPQPKMNQKSPKDPKLILILTIKLLYTYFWKMLPVGALIWLAPIWLIWAQIAQPISNHPNMFGSVTPSLQDNWTTGNFAATISNNQSTTQAIGSLER